MKANQNISVFVVSKSAERLDTVTANLKSAGFRNVLAMNATTELLKNMHLAPDAVLLDDELAGGLSVNATMQAVLRANKHVRIVLLFTPTAAVVEAVDPTRCFVAATAMRLRVTLKHICYVKQKRSMQRAYAVMVGTVPAVVIGMLTFHWWMSNGFW